VPFVCARWRVTALDAFLAQRGVPLELRWLVKSALRQIDALD
jgi:hypothetical protein